MNIKIIAILIGVSAVGGGIIFFGNCDEACAAEKEAQKRSLDLGSSGFEHVDTSSFKKLVDSGEGIVLDVRTLQEYSEGHLKSATQVDFYASDFVSTMDNLDKNATYYVYCQSGNRSGQTLRMMRDRGFVDVYGLAGGINSWKAKGFPTE